MHWEPRHDNLDANLTRQRLGLVFVKIRFLEVFEKASFALSASAATIFPAPRTGTLNVPQLAHVSEASQARDCVGVSRYDAICGVAYIRHGLCGHPSTRGHAQVLLIGAEPIGHQGGFVPHICE